MTVTPWSFSIISHNHGEEIARQLKTLSKLPTAAVSELVITLNNPEEERPDLTAWPGLLRVIENERPKSFAANHNQALEQCQNDFVALLDPDLLWFQDPFPALVATLSEVNAGIVAPTIADSAGQVVDHARPVPSPSNVVRRRLFGYDDSIGSASEVREVDWLAGLFLGCRRDWWQQLGGFDKRYRMYAEDVELCLRCWVEGKRVLRHPLLAASHEARRESRTKLLRFYWHLMGLVRLWLSPTWAAFHRMPMTKSPG